MTSVQLRIRGQVQAVGYRAWAIATATSLGLRGWVRNRTDGSVEILATGAGEVIAALIEACRHGPGSALVEAVEVNAAADDDSTGFVARRTE